MLSEAVLTTIGEAEALRAQVQLLTRERDSARLGRDAFFAEMMKATSNVNVLKAALRATGMPQTLLEKMLAESAPQAEAKALDHEPARWEWRFFDSHPHTVTSGQWFEWAPLEPRNCLCTIDDSLAEMRSHIAQGGRYQLRPLYAGPIEGWVEPQAERCTSCNDTGDLIDMTGEWRGYCVCEAGQAIKAQKGGA